MIALRIIRLNLIIDNFDITIFVCVFLYATAAGSRFHDYVGLGALNNLRLAAVIPTAV